MSRLKANRWKFYLSSFLGGWAFATGFLIFYYREIGFSYLQIFIVAVLYEVLNFLLEIPTGVLADLWSRKWTITLGHAISGASFLVVMLHPKAYWIYLLWSVLSAICTTLNSGTVTAAIYDSLRAVGDEEHFAKVQGHTFAINLVTQSTSFILGGLLADMYGFRLVLLLSGIGGLLQASVLATLTEPPILCEEDKEESCARDQGQSWRSQFARQVASSFSVMFARASVRWVLAYGVLGFIMYEFYRIAAQPYLGDLGYDSRLDISLFSAGFALVTAITSVITGQIKSSRTETSLLILISMGMTLPFVVVGIAKGPIGVGALVVCCVAIGVAEVVLPDVMNKLIPSDRRATILSAQNQLGSIGYAITATGLGTLMDQVGLNTSALIVGIISAALFTLLLLVKPEISNGTQDDRSSWCN